MWFRRDLRLADNPALLAAVDAARADGDGRVVPLFVRGPGAVAAGRPGAAGLPRCLAAGAGRQHGRRPAAAARRSRRGPPRGRPRRRGHQRPHRRGLRPLRPRARRGGRGRPRRRPSCGPAPPTRSPPAGCVKDDGTPYRVFTPFWRGWVRHGWRAAGAGTPATSTGGPDGLRRLPRRTGPRRAGAAARGRGGGAGRVGRVPRRPAWRRYADLRNRPDLAGTSAMSHHLKWGEIHPRTMLAGLTPHGRGVRQGAVLAGVLRRRAGPGPSSARESLDRRFDEAMRWTDGPGGRGDAGGVARRPHRVPAGRRRACGSCAPRAGCTTGCAWSWRASSSRTCTCRGSAGAR